MSQMKRACHKPKKKCCRCPTNTKNALLGCGTMPPDMQSKLKACKPATKSDKLACEPFATSLAEYY